MSSSVWFVLIWWIFLVRKRVRLLGLGSCRVFPWKESTSNRCMVVGARLVNIGYASGFLLGLVYSVVVVRDLGVPSDSSSVSDSESESLIGVKVGGSSSMESESESLESGSNGL
jgi:hypothetical protein